MENTKRQTAFIYSTQLNKYEYPQHIPFIVGRTEKTYELVRTLGLLDADNTKTIAPKQASRPALEKFHSAKYLDLLQLAEAKKICVTDALMGLGTLDCPVFKGMYEYSTWACGATLTAADLIVSGEADIVFNPSGGFHHARAEQAAGFCYLNDIVLGCIRLVESGKRVVFLDLDAHHGDGVQEAFYDTKDVLTISLHENAKTLFPWTGSPDEIGAADGLGYNVNIPLPSGTDDKAYLRVFDQLVIPLITAYDPDVLVVELGMDTLAGDPLAHMSLTNNAHAEIIGKLMRFDKQILATGGGGYNIEKTVRSWALAWEIFCCEERNMADFSLGLGGVMLQSSDWSGGLRDRTLPISDGKRRSLDAAIEETIRRVRQKAFRLHGISE